MKKLLLFASLAVLSASCTKKYYTIEEGVVKEWKIIEMPVSANDWRPYTDSEGLNLYFSVDFTIPELTQDIYLNGLVQCYLALDDAQAMLPSVRHYENSLGEYWTQTIDYEYYENGVSVYVTNSDFADIPPGNMLLVLHLLRKK
jgi:hypothetical protein